MIYPINYDFSKNWDTKIKPFLDDPKVIRALTRGVNGYLANWPNQKKYKKNTCPANYSSKDGYMMLMDRKRELKMKELRKAKQLPQDFLDLEKK